MAKDYKDYVDMPGVAPITPESFKTSDDAVNMPGVTPITPESFQNVPGASKVFGTPPGSATTGAPNAINLNPVEITAPLPPNKGVPISSGTTAPANQNMPTTGGGGIMPPGTFANSFASSPLGPQQGVQADAQVFADLADYYRKSSEAIGQGKFEEAQQHHNFAQEQEKSIAQSNTLWQQAIADQATREARMNQAIAKGRALSVDPNNYWNKQGTAANILSAISVGLGAFGSGMTHGATGNPALTLVNNAIDHDISAQKDNIENYWKTVQQQMHLDDNAFNRSLVTQNMMSNMRLAGFKVYESDLKAIQAKTDSQVVKMGAQKQIDDLQMAMNGERKQLAATIAAQQAAAAAQSTKDADSFNKDMMEYMKEHPGMSPQDAAKDIAAINPSRAARLGSKSALPQAAQEDFIYDKEKGYASVFNSTLGQVARANIKDYEDKLGRKATEEDKATIIQQTATQLIKQHPEFGRFQFFRPSGQGLLDVRPEAKPIEEGKGPDRRSKEQIEKDREREVYVEMPKIGADGKPVLGADGKPMTQKVKQLAINKEAAQDYVKWSNIEPTVKKQLGELKDALEKGDRARYEALRGLIVEAVPVMYGMERAPTEGQLHTTFAGAIPEWETFGNPLTGKGTKDFMQKQLDQAERGFDTLSLSKRTNTFGPQAGQGLTVGQYGAPNAAPQAPPASPPAALQPKINTDVGVPGTGTPATTWIDTRPDSPTYGKRLNIVRGIGWTYLEDPRTGKGEKATPELMKSIESAAQEKSYGDKYGAKPR